jgi:alkanesulfonate monooxygenase SsuD/methylene tetrahydromethanopterin reductase-like flavin-dependent oxidoreductase (luciferase family)
VVDPWVALAAVAMATERIRIGTLITPLARRRPWKVARETVSLDHLSGGRLTLGVGLGFPADAEFETFGEETDDRVRAEKLDEGLEILTGLWSGQPFSYAGNQFRLQEDTFLPRPVQSPRIPIWVAGIWPARAPYRRAARWDGVVPIVDGDGPPSPEDLREIVGFVKAGRSEEGPLDVVCGAGPDLDAEKVAVYEEAGATWLNAGVGDWSSGRKELEERIRRGPPR